MITMSHSGRRPHLSTWLCCFETLFRVFQCQFEWIYCQFDRKSRTVSL